MKKSILRLLFTLALALPLGAACTAALANSDLGSPISGTSYAFTIQLSSCPSVASVEYIINNQLQLGYYAQASPWSYTWNTYYAYNNPGNTVYALVRDALGATIATTSTVTFEVANTLPQAKSAISCLYSYPASPWTGTQVVTVTCSGPNAIHQKSFLTYLDGVQIGSSTGNSSASYTDTIDTTKYSNTSHDLAIIVEDNQAGQPISAPQDFSQVSQLETLVTFSNGSTPIIELRADATDVFLDLGSNTTHQIVPSAIHADASVTTPSPTYAVTSGTACSVSGSGLITALAQGVSQITLTSGSLTKIVWCNVLADLTKFYHFGSDGTLLGTYSPTNSILYSSLFFSFNGLSDPNYSQSQFASDYKGGAWKAVEVAIAGTGPSPSVGQSQSAYQSALTAYIAPYATFASTYGLKIHLLGDNLVRQNNYAYMSSRGPGTAFTPQSAVAYAYAQWQATGSVIGDSGDDEVDGAIGCCPQLGQIKIGTNGFTQLSVASGVCTATLSAPGEWIGAGDNPRKFVIDGSITANLNSTPGVVYTTTSQGTTTTVFPCPGVANATLTSANDPNLTLQQYADQWYTSTGAASSNPATAVDYARYDQMTSILNQGNTVSPRPLIGWPPGGSTGPDTPAAPYNTLGNWSAYGDYSEVYTTYSLTQSHYLAPTYPLPVLATSVGSTYRRAYSVINRSTPFLCEPTTTNTDYGFQGTTLAMTSFVGDLITFSAPHGISTVLDGITRFHITGQSNSADNADYYAYSCPTATTCHVYRSTVSFTASSGTGTIHYATSGNAFAANNLASNPANARYMAATITLTVDPTCITFKQRGQLVTVTGTGTAMDTTTYYASFNSPVATCSPPHILNLYQLPVASSTGGSALIVADNNYVRGRNIPSPIGNEIGPRFMFANFSECLVAGAAGNRDYVMFADKNSFNVATGAYSSAVVADNTTFNDTHASQQEGSHPHWSNGPNNAPTGNAIRSFEAPSAANRLYSRLSKWLLEPRQNSPDYGPLFDTSLRSSAQGQLLLVQSLNDGTQARTIDLTPLTGCAGGGQTIIKYYATWQTLSISTIAAGTATDSDAGDPGSLAAYVCPSTPGEYTPPLISAKLASIPNATKVVVQFNYSKWLLQNQTVSGTDCGTGLACSIPADTHIGPVWYQLIYLSSTGAVLARSDLQVIPQSL